MQASSSNKDISTGPESRAIRELASRISGYYLLPLLVGVFIATVVCLDSFVVNLDIIKEQFGTLTDIPYLFSTLTILACFAIPLCLKSFWERDQALLIGMIVSIHLDVIVLAGFMELYQLFLLSLLAFWLVNVLLYKESIFISSPILLLTIAFYSFVVLSFANSVSKFDSIRGIFAVFLRVVVMVFVVLNHIKTRKLLLRTIHLIFVVALFTSLVAIVQWVVWYTTGTFLTTTEVSPTDFSDTPFGVFFRGMAFFSHPNAMASALSSFFILMLYLALSPAFGRKLRRLYCLGTALLALGIAVSFSRSSMGGIALAFLIIPYLRKPSLWVHYTLALFLLAFLVLAWYEPISDVTSSFVYSVNPGSAETRMGLNEKAVSIFLDRPLTGAGIYAFNAYPIYIPDLLVHNAVLQVLSECGIFAGVLYCSIFFLMLFRLIRGAMRAEHAQEKAILKGLTLSFIVLFFEMQFDILTYLPNTWMCIALFESAVLVSGRHETLQENR